MLVVAFSALAGLVMVVMALLDWRTKVKTVVEGKSEKKEGGFVPPVLPYTIPCMLPYSDSVRDHPD